MGLVLSPILEMSGHKVLLQGRGATAQLQFEPTNITKLSTILKRNAPEIIINLAALTSVNECQTAPHLAYEANTKIVETIATAIKLSGKRIHLIQMSTDHLYDGTDNSSENDIKPSNVYAITKYAGELAARTVGATILRTTFIGSVTNSYQRKTLSDWIVSSLQAKKTITVFEDVIFSPLYIKTLCGIVTSLINIRKSGTYNLGCAGGISKANFAIRLASGLNLDLNYLSVGKLSSENLEYKRPLNMKMNTTKFINEFKIDLPDIDREIALLIHDYKNNQRN